MTVPHLPRKMDMKNRSGTDSKSWLNPSTSANFLPVEVWAKNTTCSTCAKDDKMGWNGPCLLGDYSCRSRCCAPWMRKDFPWIHPGEDNYGELAPKTTTLLGTNISPPKVGLKMIFLFARWDMLVSSLEDTIKKIGSSIARSNRFEPFPISLCSAQIIFLVPEAPLAAYILGQISVLEVFSMLLNPTALFLMIVTGLC